MVKADDDCKRCDQNFVFRQLWKSPLKCNNYTWRFHSLLYLEEHGLRTKVEKFNQKNVLVVTHKTEKDILIVTVVHLTMNLKNMYIYINK